MKCKYFFYRFSRPKQNLIPNFSDLSPAQVITVSNSVFLSWACPYFRQWWGIHLFFRILFFRECTQTRLCRGSPEQAAHGTKCYPAPLCSALFLLTASVMFSSKYKDFGARRRETSTWWYFFCWHLSIQLMLPGFMLSGVITAVDRKITHTGCLSCGWMV